MKRWTMTDEVKVQLPATYIGPSPDGDNDHIVLLDYVDEDKGGLYVTVSENNIEQ